MRQDIKISDLIVNPHNYRFEEVENEQEAIDLMLNEKGDQVLRLAEHILKYGIDKSKDIRALKKGKKFLVLDGNRRIIAIKCLNNPSLVKDSRLRGEFFELFSAFPEKVLTEVNCFIYPNEEAASEWIKLDHTGKNRGEGQDQWGAAEVDRFDYKFGRKLSPAMQAVKLLEEAGYKKINTKLLKISTVNRIFSNPDSRSFLGIDIKKGELSFSVDKSKALERINILFSKIIKDDVRVAEVYDSKKSLKFVEDLFKTKIEDDKNVKKKKRINNVQQPLNIFVITAFAGLDDVYDAIKETVEGVLKKPNVFKIQPRGAKDSLDQKIEHALDSSDFILTVLSMGSKEKAAYEAIKSSPLSKKILKDFYPINHNVLLELGYGLRSVKARGKDRDMFLLVEDKGRGEFNLKNFSMNRFFDIRNRDQISYRDIKDLKKNLKKEICNSDYFKAYLK